MIQTPTPLDSPETEPVQQHPALKWLIYYGIFNLTTRFSYTILMPLLTLKIASSAGRLTAAYNMFGLGINIIGLGIALAISIKIKDKLCQIIFGLIALSNVYSILVSIFKPYDVG